MFKKLHIINKIELGKSKSSKGLYFWRALGRNGKILCHSEMYNTRQGARKTARQVAKQCGLELVMA